MPQMAPLSWSLLFLTFIMIYTMTSSKVYYLSLPIFTQAKAQSQMPKKTMNWKW